MQPHHQVRLLTVPHSSYCEAARWLLQAAGVPYREEMWFLGKPLVLTHAAQVTAVRALESSDSPQRATRHAPEQHRERIARPQR